ncbi:hypothetical protein DM860_008439 [Cuscuta australis]|uniref:Serine-threonine/tyrosine-protein kinase catalytic domain-containing protein n=1 Tax=Cuscuta australis TaxID=267555 RepID=A0A328D8V9_9ASTE|nr:hypothetical protein DM860_008439 [Cuscuta australis]
MDFQIQPQSVQNKKNARFPSATRSALNEKESVFMAYLEMGNVDFTMQAEVNYLAQLRHPNLVKLIGYCCEDDHRLLVYEYMASGSLEEHLFSGHLTTRYDAHGFGVVLLEMLTRRRALDTRRPTGELSLMEFARPRLTRINRFFEILDPRMEGQYSKKTAALLLDWSEGDGLSVGKLHHYTPGIHANILCDFAI